VAFPQRSALVAGTKAAQQIMAITLLRLLAGSRRAWTARQRLGLRPVLCRFSFLRLPLTYALDRTAGQLSHCSADGQLVRIASLMPKPRKDKGRSARKVVFFWILFGLAVGGIGRVAILARRSHTKPVSQSSSTAQIAPANETALFATYGKSPSCRSCHEEAFQLWEHSHHALAERPLNPSLDLPAFEPPKKVHHGSQDSEARFSDGKFLMVTRGPDGQRQPFAIERVIGVGPLRQFLVPAAGGRLQTTELAFDPSRVEWFDVYGAEDRQPGEWGHWTGRGMTWNTMCAACHNTRLRKNYQANADTYTTSMAEMGVGCEACHGPMAAHNAFQSNGSKKSNEPDPTIRRVGREEMFAVCGSCHSRRAELTDDFKPGDSYFDHYALTIPDDTDTFYPDGQIRDEDYEFTSFLSSRMHAAGVRCTDCHEPHSAKTRVPGNNLCMICHGGAAPSEGGSAAPKAFGAAVSPISNRQAAGTLQTNLSVQASATGPLALSAPKIDPKTHSHHLSGERGDNCVDCHMPQTVYMQRHSRHDHGFTIPDPLLTKRSGVPNACARCHSERTVDWLVEALETWYGGRTNRPARTRAQTIARARAGESNSAAELTALSRNETNSLWRAAAAGLLRRWSADPKVTAALLAGAGDPHSLVRAVSVRALEPLAQSGGQPILTALRSRLNDPVRAVRVDAAWALHTTLDTNSPAGLDLLAYLRHNADQPLGAMQLGVFLMDRGDLGGAMIWFQRAVKWDPNSAPLRAALAVGLSLEAKSEEAVQELQAACRLAPREAEYQFKLGLALNETGKLEPARAALEQAVKLDPRFAQAWYNLGLACSALGQSESALESLVRAESLDANSAQIPYARATVLARLGRSQEARQAARRALEIQSGYKDAEELLRSLPP
jgi:predicted CXXCH cytochrome family protein